MLSRTEQIGEFHLRVSRTERDLYEEFCNTEEVEIVKEMREYFYSSKAKVRASKMRIGTRIGFTLETEKNHIALESTRAVHVVFPQVFRRTLGLEKLARFAPREQLRGILRR